MPEQEWEPAPVPRHNVICGHLYEDGIMCHEPAGPDHEHPRDDAPKVSPADLDITRDPAPGLVQTLTGRPLPTWAEMQAKYPPYVFDREKARAAVAGAKLADVPPPIHERIVEHAKAAAEAHYATQAGEVDFRHMLKDDAAAWSAKARIEKVLGRPYLATQLADQLAPDTAAALADRLESLVSQAVAETEMRLSAETSRLVTEKIAEIRATRTSPAEAVSRERFNTPSRFS